MFWNIIPYLRAKFKPKTQPQPITMDAEKFTQITERVIDSLEGGYYHPNMKARMSAQSQAIMGDSGETFFGIDRKHGTQLAKYPQWNEFWKIIDDANASTKWRHYYRGGSLEPKLKRLAAEMMFQWFTYLSNKYLKKEAQELVSNDERLMFHLSYASWNGEGFFKRFAGSINSSIGKSKEEIWTNAINSRLNHPNKVIRQQGANMKAAIEKYNLS